MKAMDSKKVALYIRKNSKLCYKFAKRHPVLTSMVCCFGLLFVVCPGLFFFLVHNSPVLICTALLLGTLLSLGQPHIPQIDDLEEEEEEVVVESSEEEEEEEEEDRDLDLSDQKLTGLSVTDDSDDADVGEAVSKISRLRYQEGIKDDFRTRRFADEETFLLGKRTEIVETIEEEEEEEEEQYNVEVVDDFIGEESKVEEGENSQSPKKNSEERDVRGEESKKIEEETMEAEDRNVNLIKEGGFDDLDHRKEPLEEEIPLVDHLGSSSMRSRDDESNASKIVEVDSSEEMSREKDFDSEVDKFGGGHVMDIEERGTSKPSLEHIFRPSFRASWRRLGEHHCRSSSSSSTDAPESLSPDASLADLSPMFDELHPLLDENGEEIGETSGVHHEAASPREASAHDAHASSHEHEESSSSSSEEAEEEEEGLNDDFGFTWTEDDEKNLRDLGLSQMQMKKLEEKLTALRRLRPDQGEQQEENLIDFHIEEREENLVEISFPQRSSSKAEEILDGSQAEPNVDQTEAPATAHFGQVRAHNPFLDDNSSDPMMGNMQEGFLPREFQVENIHQEEFQDQPFKDDPMFSHHQGIAPDVSFEGAAFDRGLPADIFGMPPDHEEQTTLEEKSDASDDKSSVTSEDIDFDSASLPHFKHEESQTGIPDFEMQNAAVHEEFGVERKDANTAASEVQSVSEKEFPESSLKEKVGEVAETHPESPATLERLSSIPVPELIDFGKEAIPGEILSKDGVPIDYLMVSRELDENFEAVEPRDGDHSEIEKIRTLLESKDDSSHSDIHTDRDMEFDGEAGAFQLKKESADQAFQLKKESMDQDEESPDSNKENQEGLFATDPFSEQAKNVVFDESNQEGSKSDNIEAMAAAVHSPKADNVLSVDAPFRQEAIWDPEPSPSDTEASLMSVQGRAIEDTELGLEEESISKEQVISRGNSNASELEAGMVEEADSIIREDRELVFDDLLPKEFADEKHDGSASEHDSEIVKVEARSKEEMESGIEEVVKDLESKPSEASISENESNLIMMDARSKEELDSAVEEALQKEFDNIQDDPIVFESESGLVVIEARSKEDLGSTMEQVMLKEVLLKEVLLKEFNNYLKDYSVSDSDSELVIMEARSKEDLESAMEEAMLKELGNDQGESSVSESETGMVIMEARSKEGLETAMGEVLLKEIRHKEGEPNISESESRFVSMEARSKEDLELAMEEAMLKEWSNSRGESSVSESESGMAIMHARSKEDLETAMGEAVLKELGNKEGEGSVCVSESGMVMMEAKSKEEMELAIEEILRKEFDNEESEAGASESESGMVVMHARSKEELESAMEDILQKELGNKEGEGSVSVSESGMVMMEAKSKEEMESAIEEILRKEFDNEESEAGASESESGMVVMHARSKEELESAMEDILQKEFDNSEQASSVTESESGMVVMEARSKDDIETAIEEVLLKEVGNEDRQAEVSESESGMVVMKARSMEELDSVIGNVMLKELEAKEGESGDSERESGLVSLHAKSKEDIDLAFQKAMSAERDNSISELSDHGFAKEMEENFTPEEDQEGLDNPSSSKIDERSAELDLLDEAIEKSAILEKSVGAKNDMFSTGVAEASKNESEPTLIDPLSLHELEDMQSPPSMEMLKETSGAEAASQGENQAEATKSEEPSDSLSSAEFEVREIPFLAGGKNE